MIQLKELKWSNWFSYGDNNYLKFSDATLTQILGVNGSGKSSIPLIVEEILYGKNSKNIKKQDITNRYTDSNIRTADLCFSVDKDEYTIKLHRNASTTKLTLLKNNEDISSHTATNTYKQIEKIIGIDFKTFNQLIYQSSKSSLEFLTATDTQRKNFLVGLLGLDKYAKIYEILKNEHRQHTKLVSELEGSCDTISKWIKSHKAKDLSIKPLEEVPNDSSLDSDKEQLVALKTELTNISQINKKRQTNNSYKQMLASLDLSILHQSVPSTAPDTVELSSKIKSYELKKAEIVTKGKKLSALTSPICPTCLQEIDKQVQDSLLYKWRDEVKNLDELISTIKEELQEAKVIASEITKYKKVSDEFEKLQLLIDPNIEEELLSEEELLNNINELKLKIDTAVKVHDRIATSNTKAAEHNSRIDLIKSQIAEYSHQLNIETSKLALMNTANSYLDILKQSFSTNGLISYKIEFMVKDLEEVINKYLAEFSEGRFQLLFSLQGEKLNIIIVDNGKEIAITALSSGELARVNISTLLAIRNLMSTLSSTKINLLFLDEIMGVLDTFGKDKLIEILLEENDLNTFIVSHDFSHPLLEKVTVVKNKGVSKLEYG